MMRSINRGQAEDVFGPVKAAVSRPALQRTSSAVSSASSIPTPPTSSDAEMSDIESDDDPFADKSQRKPKPPRTPTKQIIPSYQQRVRTNRAKNVDYIHLPNGLKTPSPKGCPRYLNHIETSEDPFAAPKGNGKEYKGKGLAKQKNVPVDQMTTYVFKGKKITMNRPLAAASLSDSEDELTKAVPRFLFPQAVSKPQVVPMEIESPPHATVALPKPATPSKGKAGNPIPPTPMSNVRRKRRPEEMHMRREDQPALSAEEREKKKQKLRAEMGLARRVGGSGGERPGLARTSSAARILFQ